MDEAYLRKRYVEDLATVEEIASEIGCSVPLVRKRLKLWKILRGRVLRKTGRIRPWNEGLTKDTDERLKRLSEARSGSGNPMAGRPAWNKGLGIDDPRIAAAASKSRGRVMSEEARQKMAAAKRGKCREQSNRWKGGLTKIGPYHEFRKTIDGRRIYAHRYVAEQCLGRKLDKLEHVHHVDRNEANNDPSNLLVLSEAGHATLHGAIYRGECDTRSEQIEWLKRAGINYLELI